MVVCGGISYEITKSGFKRWLYRYRLDNKQQGYIIGRYSEYSLEKSRKAHRKAQLLVQKGVNPALERRDKKQENIAKEKAEKEKWALSFEHIAIDWIESQKGRWSNEHTHAVLATLKNGVFPTLGNTPVDAITPPEVLKIIRKIERRGSLKIAKKVLQRISAVFRYAVQTGRATYNPAAGMQVVLKSRPVEHMPAVFDKDLAKKLAAIAESDAKEVNYLVKSSQLPCKLVQEVRMC